MCLLESTEPAIATFLLLPSRLSKKALDVQKSQGWQPKTTYPSPARVIGTQSNTRSFSLAPSWREVLTRWWASALFEDVIYYWTVQQIRVLTLGLSILNFGFQAANMSVFILFFSDSDFWFLMFYFLYQVKHGHKIVYCTSMKQNWIDWTTKETHFFL